MRLLFLIIFLVVFINAFSFSSDINDKGVEKNFIDEKEVLKKSNLIYPKIAFEKKIEGWVSLIFEINEKGEPLNIKVLNSYPKNVFEKSSIETLSKWQFKPKTIEGKTVPFKAKIRFDFKLKPDTIKKDYKKFILLKKVNPLYPKNAKENKTEGRVTLSFEINEKGKTQNIKIDKSYPKDVFDKNAIDALSKWKFKVKDTGNKDPIKSKITFNFKLKKKLIKTER